MPSAVITAAEALREAYKLQKDWRSERKKKRIAKRLQKQQHKVDMLNAELLAHQAGDVKPEGN